MGKGQSQVPLISVIVPAYKHKGNAIGTEKMARISGILPVYNASAFLRRCPDGLAAQTFRDFETVLRTLRRSRA